MALPCSGARHVLVNAPFQHHHCSHHSFQQPWNPHLCRQHTHGRDAKSQARGKARGKAGTHTASLTSSIPGVYSRWKTVSSHLHARKVSCAGCQRDRQMTLAL